MQDVSGGESSTWVGEWIQIFPTPLIICGRQLELIYCNEAGAKVLANGDKIVAPPPKSLNMIDRAWTGDLAKLVRGLPAGQQKSAVCGHILFRVRALGSDTDPVALTCRLLECEPAFDCAGLEGRFGATRAETRVLRLLLKGLTISDIAEHLNNSELTIRTHVKRIYAKLGVRSREQLFARVLPHLFIY